MFSSDVLYLDSMTENKFTAAVIQILKEKIRLLPLFYKNYFWFETGKYFGNP
jgi:hypothetical protein